MEVKLYPSQLQGSVSVPESKSLLHRHLICQALAGEFVTPTEAADDIRYTAQALAALRRGESRIDCGMSGSTLRFLLPLAMAQGRVGVTFTGDSRLLERPLHAPLPMERTEQGWRITGELTPGTFCLAADETSQLVSGLLMSLPLLNEPSKIMLTTDAVSKPYIDMTIAVMKAHGVLVEKRGDSYEVFAPQTYQSTGFSSDGDWSAAAWYVVMNKLQDGEIQVENLTHSSLQGDKKILDYVNLTMAEIDISQTPDLLPTLALWAALQEGKTTRFTHAGFLRGKESDRLENAARILNALGAQVKEEADRLTVFGVANLQGGVSVDACADHRMAMLAAFAAALCRQPVTLIGAEFVVKSYPDFWQDYTALGGKMEVIAL